MRNPRLILELALVVFPGHREDDHPFWFHDALEDASIAIFPVA